MSHSITSTSSYILSKYSRSYPKGPKTYSDWQHFTNPEIRLVLDVTKSSNSELQEVRLRVQWIMSEGNDNQPQITFASEDIELLSFSSLAVEKMMDKCQQLQALPIKAVYQDNLVGIRYLHPKDSVNATPTYRRFQVTFASPAVVTEFINSICTVCPCRLNPTSNSSRNAPAEIMKPPQIPFRLHATTDHGATTIHLPSSTSGSRAPADKQTSQVPLSSPQFPSSSQQEKDLTQWTSSPAHSCMEQSQLSYTQDARPQFVNQGFPDHHETGTRPNRIDQQQSQSYFLESQLSSQGVQASSNQISIPVDNDPQAKRSATEINNKFLSALQEMEKSELYNLSPDVLEQIVGEIVHEKGFPELLKSLEKLWAIKDLARIYM